MNRLRGSSKPGRYSRAAFLARAAASLTGLSLLPGALAAPQPAQPAGASKVRHWAVITIGNLSRNHYWGESDAKALRSAICTTTLIEGPDFRLLVDPSLENRQEMERELERRSGLKLAAVTAVFITHEHADHFAGLTHFPQARWFAGPGVASLLNGLGKWDKAIEPVTGKLFEALEVVPTPGHTAGLHSLRFDCRGRSVAVVGDAVATEDFWRERRGYFNCVDFEQSAESMEKIAALADLVVPGHDNYFLTGRAEGTAESSRRSRAPESR